MRRKGTGSFNRLKSLEWAGPIGVLAGLALAVGITVPTSVDIYQSWQNISDRERAKVGIELIQLIATVVGGVAIFWNITLSRWQLAAAQEQNITDRFSKAVEQLGHSQIPVRIGGIYALARIAQDSRRDHWIVMEVLTAFVRDRRGLGGADFSDQPVRFDKDVQSAIAVIGRRNSTQDPENSSLYMSYNDLRGLAFFETDYQNAHFHGSDLREVDFNRCNLQNTRFRKANLAKAKLRDADLRCAMLAKANLQGTNLQNCSLQGADLSRTNLREANLQGANLQNSSLQGADLRQANLKGVRGLTLEQVHSASNWQEAIYDPTFFI